MKISHIINRVLHFFHLKTLKIQSFTYYVPSGAGNCEYREKQFDNIINRVLNLDFKILSTKIVQNSSSKHSGFWVIFLLQSLNTKASQIDLNDIFKEAELKNQEAELEIEYD